MDSHKLIRGSELGIVGYAIFSTDFTGMDANVSTGVVETVDSIALPCKVAIFGETKAFT